jgi:hypothetical protein
MKMNPELKPRSIVKKGAKQGGSGKKSKGRKISLVQSAIDEESLGAPEDPLPSDEVSSTFEEVTEVYPEEEEEFISSNNSEGPPVSTSNVERYMLNEFTDTALAEFENNRQQLKLHNVRKPLCDQIQITMYRHLYIMFNTRQFFNSTNEKTFGITTQIRCPRGTQVDRQ